MTSDSTPPESGRTGSIRHLGVARLRRQFLERGKAQPETFARLSLHIEKLCVEARQLCGERSGAMQRAFGENLVRMKGRFTAKNGTPPARLYQTPAQWLQVLTGFADVLERNLDALLLPILEDALAGPCAGTDSSSGHPLEELQSLFAEMTKHLQSVTSIPALMEYVAQSGLILQDGDVTVSEWPSDQFGYSQDDVYTPSTLGLVPHVFGLNYAPLSNDSWDLADCRSWVEAVPELAQAPDGLIHSAATLRLTEGTRTGLAFVVYEPTGEPELAFVESQHAEIAAYDHDNVMLWQTETMADLTNVRSGVQEASMPGTPASARIFQEPLNWLPNSVRLHFPGSAGFARLASSLIVQPWIWTDPVEHEFWSPDPTDFEDYPVIAPRHTVAAAIEGNLLYADDAGRSASRLDRVLLAEVRRVEKAIRNFRTKHETRRLSSRASVLAEWHRPEPSR